MLIFQLFLQISEGFFFQKVIVQHITFKIVALYLKKI